MTTLNEILETPRYNDLYLFTNKETGNTSHIKSIEISETPDIEHYIPKGTVLLSTAMIFKENQQDMKAFIDSLVRAEAIGLGIKVNRFLGYLDQSIIDYANKINFPIFQIPDNYNLGAILHQWSGIVWNRQHEEISFALDIQRSFQDLVVRDVPNQIFVNEFSQMIKSPVILLDSFYEVITYSNYFKGYPGKLNDFVKQIRIQSNYSTDETISYIVNDLQGNPAQVAVRSLNIHNYFNEYLVILNPEQIPQPINHFAIDQAALVLSFVLLKNDKLHQLELTTEADYFKDWISMRGTETQNNSNKHGFIASDYYQVIKITDLSLLNKQKEQSISHKENLWLIALWLERALSELSPKAKVIYSTSNLETLILLQERPTNLIEKLEKLAITLVKRINIRIAYNIGEAVDTTQQIERSLTQARITHDERLQNGLDDTFISYENKGIHQLFSNLNTEQTNFFIKNVLGSFADPQDESLSDLRETLYVYLNSQCEVAKTASQLYVHRNTVKYRIQKCEEILDLDISDAETSLNLRIALELLKEQGTE
ncbi:PucR family transcriptional regulator [Aerococcaceae bacterium DSM 111176]|nr:PucR family transcriptional regulator [Aerococcaceae bacterium DSM 111176]